jgi:hypothetical protein
MPDGLKETHNVMKKGRAYKNIHAILNKYTHKRIIYLQTTVKVSRDLEIFCSKKIKYW